MKRPSARFAVALVLVVGVGTTLLWWNTLRERAGDRLEIAVNHIPLGSIADEADRLVGSHPDQVQVESLVMINPALSYSSTNANAKKYGVPQPHTVRIWQRGSVGAAVTLDRNGRVVGRTSWGPQPKRRTAYFRWLGLPF